MKSLSVVLGHGGRGGTSVHRLKNSVAVIGLLLVNLVLKELVITEGTCQRRRWWQLKFEDVVSYKSLP